MSYTLHYHHAIAEKDLLSIDQKMKKRIEKAIGSRLLIDPLHYGAPLHGSLKGYRKLRVGDYRVIYEIVGTEIRIYTIGHRKDVYEANPRKWV